MNRKSKDKNPLKQSHARPDASTELGNGVTLKTRFWLEKNGEIFLASGRIEILRMLSEHGSISSAAEAMGVSYHHAWNLLDKMNILSEDSMILTSQGGKGGGGSELTPYAIELINKFITIQEQFQALVEEINVSFDVSEK
jgi:molybdate transport system regulatory protein